MEASKLIDNLLKNLTEALFLAYVPSNDYEIYWFHYCFFTIKTLRPLLTDFKPFKPAKRVDDSFSRKYNPYNEQFAHLPQ